TNVWSLLVQNSSNVSIASSDPSVVSVPAGFNPGSKFTFAAHGVAPGTATIRLFTPASTLATLTVDVVAPGTKPRWPGGLKVTRDSSPVPFDKPAIFTI